MFVEPTAAPLLRSILQEEDIADVASVRGGMYSEDSGFSRNSKILEHCNCRLRLESMETKVHLKLFCRTLYETRLS